MEQVSAASQNGSHFSLEPISAAILAEREHARRDAVRELGYCETGCKDLDEYVLAGGFQRGTVVGISAEDEEMGVLLGFQTLSHSLCSGLVRKALIITPKPPNTILGGLRDSIKAELSLSLRADENGHGSEGVREEVTAQLRTCLDRVMVSCVFDFDGLWEVLADLDESKAPESSTSQEAGQETDNQRASKKSAEVERTAAPTREEIQDSEDEELSPVEEESPVAIPAAQQPPPSKRRTDEHPTSSDKGSLVEIIIVTHLSSLMTSLFTHREKSAAHSTLQLLASHLRHLARTLPSNPLIILLNSTTSTAFNVQQQQQQKQQPIATEGQAGPMMTQQQQYSDQPPPHRQPKATDATLRSIFHPAPATTRAASSSSLYSLPPTGMQRGPKPSFGLVFSQMLDLHLLCTLIPKTCADAEAAAITAAGATGERVIDYVWAAEVLLDEAGIWEGKRGVRRSREQRWGVLTVREGRVSSAFSR